MKILKRVIGIFFIITALIGVSFLSSACDNKSLDPEPSIIAEVDRLNQDEEEQIEEENNIEEETDKDEKEERIYISSLSLPETIYLSNNGIGVDFIIEYLPKNTTENIVVSIENESIVNFASEISEENRENLINFTTSGNILYPLSVGHSFITITAKSSENETIDKRCLIIVENESEIDLQIINENSLFMSGQKCNGEYEIYSAKICSLNSIQNKNLNIIKSDHIQIIEESLLYYEENGVYYLYFNFYLTGEDEHFLSISVEQNYSNLDSTIFSEKIEFSSVDFIKIINVDVKRIDNKNVLKDDSKFLLYLVEKEELKEDADLEGLFNNYILDFDISIENLSIKSENSETVLVVNTGDMYKIIANGIGKTEILISTTDGSGQSITLDIEVRESFPLQLKIGEVDLGSENYQQNLEEELSNLEIVLGEQNSLELNILISKYVKDSYAYFYSESEDLIVSSINSFQGDNILKTFTFTSTKIGEYNIDFVINEEIYSFVITVKPYPYEFRFQEIASQNVNYDFVNREIIISSAVINSSFISFYCYLYYNDEEVDEVCFDLIDEKKSGFFEQSLILDTIYLRIKRIGTFFLTITDRYSQASTTFTITISE